MGNGEIPDFRLSIAWEGGGGDSWGTKRAHFASVHKIKLKINPEWFRINFTKVKALPLLQVPNLVPII